MEKMAGYTTESALPVQHHIIGDNHARHHSQGMAVSLPFFRFFTGIVIVAAAADLFYITIKRERNALERQDFMAVKTADTCLIVRRVGIKRRTKKQNYSAEKLQDLDHNEKESSSFFKVCTCF